MNHIQSVNCNFNWVPRSFVLTLLFFILFRLSYLHLKKIVHRDVKTENMLLDKTRTVKIADFGVARLEASNPNDMTGETGTLGYMAPEVYSLYAFFWVLQSLSLSLLLVNGLFRIMVCPRIEKAFRTLLIWIYGLRGPVIKLLKKMRATLWVNS